MTTEATTKLLTADDLLAMPDDDQGHHYELVEGRLVRVTGTSFWSGSVSSLVHMAVINFVRSGHLGIVADAETGWILATNPDTVRMPDVGFVRAERIPPRDSFHGYFPGAPDLAVEVRSPTDRTGAVMRKVGEYIEAGTRLVWVIDPQRRTAAVFRSDGSITVLSEDGILDGEDVLPGFTLPLAGVWV